MTLQTYLHHHGSDNPEEKMPWYRGEQWSYLRGGLTCLDRDYGIFNKIHHDIGTHVVHHLVSREGHQQWVQQLWHTGGVGGGGSAACSCAVVAVSAICQLRWPGLTCSALTCPALL
jgi:hypothetical protein